jgi:hypothetical protein
MKKVFFITLFFFQLLLSLQSQITEDFESYSCIRNNAVTAGWSFSSFDLNSSQPIGGGCNARSSQLSNPGGNYQLTSPAMQITGESSATFSYNVTSTSSTPNLELFYVDLDAATETLLWSSGNIGTANTTFTQVAPFTGVGNCKLKWAASGNGGNSRLKLDDIFVPAASPLPVILKSFFAKYTEGRLRLTWETETEVDFTGFEVIGWSAKNRTLLDFIPAAGPGRYEYLMENPAPGAYYFQLILIDEDGSVEQSPLVFTEVPLAEGLSAWVDSQAHLHINLSGSFAMESLTVSVYSANGVLRRQFHLPTDNSSERQLTMPLEIHETGEVFFIHLSGGNMERVFRVWLHR